MDVERIVPRPLARAVIVGIVAAAGVGTAAAQGGPYERQKVDPAAATRGRAVYADPKKLARTLISSQQKRSRSDQNKQALTAHR